MKLKILRFISVSAALLVAFSVFLQGFACFADSAAGTSESYETYKSKTGNNTPAAKEISFAATEYASIGGGTAVSDEYGALVIPENGSAEWIVTTEETALYRIGFEYVVPESGIRDFEFLFKIDGNTPFSELRTASLTRFYKNSYDTPHKDGQGNEYAPTQIPYDGFMKRCLHDSIGSETKDYEFLLTQGKHTFSFENANQQIIVKTVFLASPERTASYNEVKAGIKAANYEGEPIVLEGEDAYLKTSHSLTAKADNGSNRVTPASASVSKLNYIGGTTWKNPGEEAFWKFTAPKDGFYKVGFSFKQSGIVNGWSYRKLKIDGEVPFAEAENVRFGYKTDWQFKEFGDDNGEYLIYLSAGEHILSLEATLGETAELYNELNTLILDIGSLYLDIVMITGEKPDANRDYDLFKQIDGFNETLDSFNKRLTALAEGIEKTAGNDGNQYSASVKNMLRVVKEMQKNPYTAQNYLTDYYNQYSSLGSLLSDMTAMPLYLDQIRIAAPGADFGEKKSGWFKSALFGMKRFCASFTNDYSSTDKNSDSSNSIKIWCNWGRDQAMVLSNLISESFTDKTGIKVNLELTNASLIKGVLSDTQPDLSLQMSRTEPVNLAMRGALYDLTKFDDYSEVVKRFGKTASIPYEYKNGIYALPDTQSFYLMFYRNDIFNELGLEVPNTWDEFLDVAAKIQRNNMTVYLPYTQITATTTVNTGVGGLNLFAGILQQYGSGLYNSDKTACVLDQPVALSAFRFWTQMYTKYKIPTTQSFYNRFKVGTCPLGIEVYTQYTQIEQAAHEINGRWGIALVPGKKNEDGTINRAVAGSGSGCAILEKSTHKKEAWEFLKWWTSPDTQLAYNNGVESILGTISRTTTATLEAFERMSWEREDLEILKEQRAQIVEIPEVPGSYYLSRAVDQAYWSVVNGDSNEKDALVKWSKIANNEIDRKIKQYS